MTRAQCINKVKAKLEEISPFEEPDSLMVTDSGANTNVKPIISYIEESLDEATKDCLNNLPLSLIASDIDNDPLNIFVDNSGIGRVNGIDEYIRLSRVHCNEWKRDVTAFITSSDPIYLLQQNEYTRGKVCKPVVVYVPELNCLELYSFPNNKNQQLCGVMSYVDCRKKAERVQSKIEDFIVLRCATIVLEILNDKKAEIMMVEYNNKLNDVIK